MRESIEPSREERGKNFPRISWKREVPVRYVADVAVLGGGIAGMCAACAAAACGVSVILVERFAIAGGVLTTGGVANFSGDTRGIGEIFDDILSGLERFSALGPLRDSAHNTKEQLFDHEVLAIVLQELLLRRDVKILLHTRIVDVQVKDGIITEAIVCGPSGPEAVRAKVFVDCTGEGQAAYMAGFSTMKGRPSDGLQLSMSLMAFVRHVNREQLNDPDLRGVTSNKSTLQYSPTQVPEGWFRQMREEAERPMVSVWPNGPLSNALKIKVPGYDSTDTESLTDAEIRGRRRFFEVLDYFQRVEKRPWILDHCSPIIGIREGRRIVGDYVLTVEDVRAGRNFDDGVARGTWYLDAHSPDDEKRTYLVSDENMGVPPYQIPLGCLIARDGNNLLMAGRCLSADQMAHSSARVSPTGAMMGQAVGICAALSVKKGCLIREIDPSEVRKIVIHRNGKL